MARGQIVFDLGRRQSKGYKIFFRCGILTVRKPGQKNPSASDKGGPEAEGCYEEDKDKIGFRHLSLIFLTIRCVI